MTTLNYTETLTVVHCTCGIAHGIPSDLHKQMLNNRGPRGVSVHCPHGHVWHYVGKTEAEKERELRERAEKRERAVRELLLHEENSHRSTRGQLTKVKKRVAAGVCPHCNRTFQNVQRHMKSKHPEECSH